MHEAVKLLFPQIADQAGIGEALDVRIEIAGKKTPDEGQSPDQPGMFGQAIDAAGQGEEGVAADGIGPLTPDDSSPEAAETGALEAMVNEDRLGGAEGEPAVAAGVGFVDDVPAVNALQSPDIPETSLAVKFGLARARGKGYNAPRASLPPRSSKVVPLAIPTFGSSKAAIMAAKVSGPNSKSQSSLAMTSKGLSPRAARPALKAFTTPGPNWRPPARWRRTSLIQGWAAV